MKRVEVTMTHRRVGAGGYVVFPGGRGVVGEVATIALTGGHVQRPSQKLLLLFLLLLQVALQGMGVCHWILANCMRETTWNVVNVVMEDGYG